MIRNCYGCDHLQHTSPTQVFWRCSFWCEGTRAKSYMGTPASLMCHRQPEAPACAYFEPYHGKRAGDVRADANGFRLATV